MIVDYSKEGSLDEHPVGQHKLFRDALLILCQITSEVCHVWHFALNFPIYHLL